MWMSFNKHIQEHDKLTHLIPSKPFILHPGFAENGNFFNLKEGYLPTTN